MGTDRPALPHETNRVFLTDGEVGKIADILIVAGNPLDDMNALTDVHMVIHNGEVIRKEYTTN